MKQPKASPQPFPWRCHECGEKAVRPSLISYEATLRHEGRLHSFTIQELDIPVCSSCGAKVFTEAVDRQISAGYRAYAELLSPEQIREAIGRIGLQQKEVARHLAIAEESLSRWLNESQIQSRSMDRLLRIYFAFPEVRTMLSGESNRSTLGLLDIESRQGNSIVSSPRSRD